MTDHKFRVHMRIVCVYTTFVLLVDELLYIVIVWLEHN